jgi:tetratricopeptide (TPR) repeat protein
MGYLYRYDQAQNLEKALNSFLSAINLDEKYTQPYVALAEVFYNKFLQTNDSKWLNEMSSIIDKLKQLEPDHKQINYLSAELAANKGEYDMAIKLYQASISQNPNHVRSLVGIANAFKNTGDDIEAESYFKNAIKVAPNNWRVVSDLGVFYYTNGEYIKADEQFKRLVEMSPNNHYAYKLLAASFYATGNMSEAIYNTRLANQILPTDSGFSNLGTMLFSIEKYDEAVSAFEKALAINDSRYVVWGNLADSYKLTNNKLSDISFTTAVKKAKEVLSNNPNDSAVKADLSYYLANLGFADEAVFFAEQIGEKNDGFENFIVALCYDELNQIDKALSHLKLAIDKNYPMNEIKNTPLLVNVKTDKNYLIYTKL